MVSGTAEAAEASEHTIPVMLHLGSATGSGSVEVDLEIAENVNQLGIPGKLVDVPLTTITVNGAGTRKISVPVTPAVLRHASSGVATFEFFAWFGDQEATSMASLPVAPASGNVAATMPSVPVILFSPYQKEAPSSTRPPPCTWFKDGGTVEKSNLIGQMQVAASTGSRAAWDYTVQADSTFGVAVSGSPAKNYTVDGSFTITQTFSGDGGFTAGPKFNRFVYGHFYRQRYLSDKFLGHPICGHNYKAYFPSAVGDSYPQGKKRPAKDPYSGGCLHDPHGYAEMKARGGHYDSDRGHATDYSTAATIFDITVSGQTGYSDDIHISYMNSSKLIEYACGNANLPDAPILWSNSSGHR